MIFTPECRRTKGDVKRWLGFQSPDMGVRFELLDQREKQLAMPKRIQRRRTKGWKMPPNAVYVGRPTIWGNPFDMSRGETRMSVLTWYLEWLTGKKNKHGSDKLRLEVLTRLRVGELRGKNLACWCPLDQPCHADVLLEIAND